MFFTFILFHPGGYSWKFLVGVCRPVLQILTLLRNKKSHLSHTFSDLASKKSSSLLRLEQQPKEIYSNPRRIRIFLFLSYSFGIETINTFIHSRGSLEIMTPDSRLKWQSLYFYPFSDQNASKTIPSGVANTCMAYIREYPPSIFLFGTTCSLIFVERLLCNVN